MENFEVSQSPLPGAGGPAGPRTEKSEAVRVWLVDDNDQLRTMVAELLGQFGGIDCARHFSSPDELLSTLASKPGPDVILLDVQMGDRNGLDAVRPIKSLTRSTRVLMFTTCYNEAWRERALGDGASDYLLKSDGMDRVAARIRTPAEDPASGLVTRRRASCPPPAANETPRPVMERSVKRVPLLRRTLRMFGVLAN